MSKTETAKYTIEDGYVTCKDPDAPYHFQRFEIWRRLPEIGEKYNVVVFCDYENTQGLNYVIEVTAENRAEIAFHMNDTLNDITEYILLDQ